MSGVFRSFSLSINSVNRSKAHGCRCARLEIGGVRSATRKFVEMENSTGYIQNLSPIKRGTKRKNPYFDFAL